jgi:hypothetical protein
VRLLRIDERPNFIDLYALAGQVAQHPILIGSAGNACVHKQTGYGVLADAKGAGDGADAHPLAKQGQNLGSRLSVQLIHVDLYA